MKVLRVFLVVIFAIFLLAFVGVYIFIKTIDINKYKSQITDQLKTALKRDVELGNLKLDMSLSQGIFLNVQGFQIKDAVDFSKEIFFNVDQVQLVVDVLAFVQKRAIVVARVEVNAPQIYVLRTKEGQFNIPMMPDAAGEGNTSTGNASSTPTASNPPSPASQASEKNVSLPPVTVRSIVLKKGDVRFVDRMQSPELNIEVKGIDLKVTDFSLTEPFKFFLMFSLWSTAENFQIAGNGQLNLPSNQIQMSDVNFKSDLSLLSLAAMKRTLPQLQSLPIDLGEAIKGNVLVSTGRLVAGAPGLIQLSAQGEIDQGRAVLNKIPIGINGHFSASEKDLDLADLTLQVNSGTVVVKGKVSDYLQSQKTALEISAQQLPVEPFVPSVNPQIKFTGNLNTQTQMALDGLQSKNPLEALHGQGQVSITDGQLLHMNLLSLILGQIPMLPNLMQDLAQKNLPPEFQEIFTREHTVFQKIESDFGADQGIVDVNRVELTADMFGISGKARMDAQQNLNVDAALYIAPELSSKMTASVQELQGLMEPDGRIKIPFKPYQGPATAFKPMPDLEYIGKKVIVNRGVNELKKWLGGALEKNGIKAPTEQPQGDQSSPSQDQNQPAPAEQMLDNIFNKVFK